MTERFLKMIPLVLKNEGHDTYTDIKNDIGGPTRYGVTLATLKSLKLDLNEDHVINAQDVKDMDLNDAYTIYYNNYYKPYYETVPEKLATKLFDVAVNCGTGRSNILLQRALNNLGSKLSTDGLVGNQTFNEIKKYQESDILKQYCIEQKEFYDAIVKNNPTQKKFIKGWYNRADFMCK